MLRLDERRAGNTRQASAARQQSFNFVRRVLPALLLFSVFSAHAEDDYKPEIINRCIYHMGEFGVEAVDICVKGEVAEAESLMTYPKSAAGIIARCTEQTKNEGWAKVRACVDKKIREQK